MTITLAFYKGRRSANPSTSIWDRLICLVTRGPYSHVELVDPDDGTGWTSSMQDDGVRNKWINWDSGHWDFITVPGDPRKARAVIEAKLGEDYDYMGLLFFVVPWHVEDRKKSFCSEIVARALGIDHPWTLSPNDLFTYLQAAYPSPVTPLP